MRISLLVDWRTLRLCEPEQAHLLSRALGAGVPVLLVSVLLGLVLHNPLFVAFLLLGYALVVTTIAFRLVSSVQRTLAALDHVQDADSRSRPTGSLVEDRGEQLEHRIALILSEFDDFRAQHRRASAAAMVAAVVIVLGMAGWLLVSLPNGTAAPAPPAALLDGPSTTQTFSVSGLAASAARGGTGMLDTGLVLRGNTPVVLEATGSMSCVATYSWCTVDPSGDSTFETTRAGAFPLPGAPAWGLIAQVGTGPIQFIGAGATVTGSGKLFLGVNDNYPKDNLGSFEVSATFPCALVTATAVDSEAKTCQPGP